jgi:hypothetical protein
MQMLAQAIDRRLSAGLSVEPSLQLISNVRRQIAEQAHRVAWWRQRSIQLTAVGVCAALAVLVLAVRSAREFKTPTHDQTVASVNVPPSPKQTVHPRVKAAMEAGTTAQPASAPVRHPSQRATRGKASDPEIIVEPGQMRAILRLAAAAQSGQIDGAKLVIDQKYADEPLVITPLVITPLKVPALDDEAAPVSGKDGKDDQNFVAEHLN